MLCQTKMTTLHLESRNRTEVSKKKYSMFQHSHNTTRQAQEYWAVKADLQRNYILGKIIHHMVKLRKIYLKGD